MALPLLLTQAEVRRLFDYDPSTGLLSWRVRTSTRVKVGDIVKCQHPKGYTQVGVHGHRCLVHHIVWLWVHGEAPSCDIDHINRDRADNRIDNLRCVSRTENLLNSRHKNSSGFPGVHKTACGKYNAGIHFKRKRVHIGNFETAENAFLAYCDAHVRLYGQMSKFSESHINPY